MLDVDISAPVIKGIQAINEREVIGAAGEKVAADVRARAKAGVGVKGSLPSPKRGGRAFNATGRLSASITSVLRVGKKNQWRAVVRPVGPRKYEDLREAVGEAEWKKQIRRETFRRRAIAINSLESVKSAKALGAKVHKEAKKAARKLDSIKAIRFHPVDTMASLAAVLSLKDKRKGHGSRNVLVVVAVTHVEASDAQRVVREKLKVDLIVDQSYKG